MEAPAGQGVRVMWLWDGKERTAIIDTHDYAKLSGYKQSYVKQMCDEGKLIATKYNGRWWVHVNAEYDSISGDVTWVINLS